MYFFVSTVYLKLNPRPVADHLYGCNSFWKSGWKVKELGTFCEKILNSLSNRWIVCLKVKYSDHPQTELWGTFKNISEIKINKQISSIQIRIICSRPFLIFFFICIEIEFYQFCHGDRVERSRVHFKIYKK